ncbi:alkaline protease secretion ATP-binding protein [Paracoccus aminophilus JCM 7686]|uniref:Alkaline protease secretion ATP-binding protein n=2 Tax=Paracoccus aminophilus TaxID=34003 RepID=S5YA13_PARAH|nr:alkaline protease secretion ATP-binding protein [Paracoccus aminophilus JCM 7686]
MAWRASRPGLVTVMVFTTIFNLLKFAMPLYLVQVLDRVPASRSIETLVMLTVLVVIAILCGLALDVVRRRLLVNWGMWVERQFGPRMLHRGLSETRAARQASEISRALTDVTRLRSFICGPMASWLDVIFAPLFFLGVWMVHPVLGLIGLIALALLIAVGVASDLLTREPRRVSGDAQREASSLVTAAEQNKESVGALAMAPILTERWRRTASSRLDERERIEGRQILFRTMIRGLNQFLRIAMIAAGVWLVVHGAMTLGGIFAARIMAGFGFSLAEKALRNYRNLREAMTSYGALKERLTDEDVARTSVLPGTESAPVVIDKLTFRHAGARDDLFRRLSVTLACGEVLIISGTAGMGKTSLSRLLVGILEPRHGQIRLGDVELARLPSDLRATLVGYMPQHTELFAGTVRENIARMGEGSFADVVAAAKLVGIHELIVGLVDGYDTEITGDTFGLSGSERKRIALARAFYQMPRLIVLDEPTANLDAPSRRIVEGAIRAATAAGSSIIITQSIHSARLARLADRFLILGAKSPEIAENSDRQAEERARNGLRSVQ